MKSVATAKRGDLHYVKNSELHESIVKWYESGKEEVPHKITNAIMQICQRLSSKSNFCGYSWRDEMVSCALLACVIAIQKKKYKIDRSQNPFAYFSQIANNEMIRVIKDEKKQSYIKHKSLENHVMDMALAGEVAEISLFEDGNKNYDLIYQFEPDKNVEEKVDEPESDT